MPVLKVKKDGGWLEVAGGGSAGSGSSVQPDYNQNDPTAADYIKNRPFYIGDLVETELADVNALLAENDSSWQKMTEATVDDINYLWTVEAPPFASLEVGKQYAIEVNGNKHTGVATPESIGMDIIVVGDFDGYMSYMTSGDASELEWLLLYMPNNAFGVIYKGAEAPTEFKIYGMEQEIVKIDPKYLPEGGVGYVETNSTVETFDIIQIINDMGGMWETVTGEDSPTNKTMLIGQFAATESPISIIEGIEYQTTVNGITTTDTAVDYTNIVGAPFPYMCIGDFDELMNNPENVKYAIALMGPIPDENLYQFQVMLDAETFGLTEVPTELTISGTNVTETIHKIDSRYLPKPIKSDWNENDPEVEGYIENRPFYEGLVAGDVLLEETFENFESGELSEPIAFVEGETYFVTLNGEQYKCVAWFDETINSLFGQDAVGIGSTAFTGFTNKGSNGEPFYLAYTGEKTLFAVENVGTHALKIQSATMAVAKKIDKKFLPDDISGVNIETAEVGHFVRVKAVDDVGKPVEYEATEVPVTSVNGETGDIVIIEGLRTIKSGSGTSAEKFNGGNTASGDYSHAEGSGTIASGTCAHAECCGTEASGECSHAEGSGTIASGDYSHAEGSGTESAGECSHAEGYLTKAVGAYQHVQGKSNIFDNLNKYAHIIGNGSVSRHSNAHTVDWDGNAWYAGDVYVGSTSGRDRDEGSKRLATEEYVDAPKTEFILNSSTEGSTKKFKITIDDDGVLTATEIV